MQKKRKVFDSVKEELEKTKEKMIQRYAKRKKTKPPDFYFTIYYLPAWSSISMLSISNALASSETNLQQNNIDISIDYKTCSLIIPTNSALNLILTASSQPNTR